MAGIVSTQVPKLPLRSRGKVRDIYDLGDRLLFVATDRISAFDVVLPQPVPDKGKVLNQISVFWFRHFRGLVANHLITADFEAFPSELKPFGDQLAGRSMIVRKAEMVPIECVARGYLSGSGLKEYRAGGTVCGIPLPPGLGESDRLPEPIFTPATKEETGHDINISYEETVRRVGSEMASTLRRLTLTLYKQAAAYAEERGIIIADTKFEFGVIDGQVALCDEVLTPDSSRFWPKAHYKPGRPQPSFDKQYVRDYLERISWNKQPPPPDLPPEVIEGTRERYLEALQILTGKPLRE